MTLGVVGQTADPEEPQQVVATVTFPTAKVPNVYAKTPGNVEIGFEERLFKKARPTAFTGEDLGKFGQVVSALCGWNNGTESCALFSFRKLREWCDSHLFEDLSSKKWTATRFQNNLGDPFEAGGP